MSPNTSSVLPADRVAELRGLIRGSVALPGEPAYTRATPWNLSARFEPAAVVSVRDADDIAATFRFAEATGLRVAVQTTGHGAVDRGSDTLVVHTGALNVLEVDPDERVARIGAAVTADRLLDAAGEHGLAPVLGSAGTVGVVGYLTGGGVGPLVSTFGLSSDFIRSLEVVTADGRIRHVSPAENPDLFWAFRGGKALLGIVTEVTIELPTLSHVYGGAIWFAGEDSSAVLNRWATWSSTLPDEMTTSVALMRLPDGPASPPPLAGRLTVAVRIGTTLSAEDADVLLAPLRAAAEPVIDTVGTLQYRDIGRIHNEPRDPEPLLQDQSLLTSFPAAAVDALVDVSGPGRDSPLIAVEVRRFGGALARKPEHESAFSFRDAPYSVTAIGLDFPGIGERSAADIRTVIGALSPWSDGRILANFVATDDSERASSAYSGETRQRLDRLIETYDPSGIMTA